MNIVIKCKYLCLVGILHFVNKIFCNIKSNSLSIISNHIAVKSAEDSKRKREIEKRLDDLSKLIRKVYEDRVLGNLPDKTCAELLADYQQEKETLQAELDELLKRSETMAQDEADVDEYIRRLKSYAGVDTLTRQMAMDLLEYVTVDRYEGEGKPRSIHIYYKLIDKPLRDKNNALA